MFSKFLFITLALGLIACTKERAYEFVPNKKTVPKEVFSNEDYGNLKNEDITKLTPQEKKQFKTPRVAVLSYGQATRSASASLPYFQGRTKLVEFELGEKFLEVRELEKDPRFTDNPTNNRIIMTIPIRHVGYTCEKDAYGECQNKEIEDSKTPWKDRPSVEVDFDQANFIDVDELPVEITNLFSGCFTEQKSAQKLINVEFDKNVLNFEIQKSFTLTNVACLKQVTDFENLFENLNFDVRYVYSIVRADQLTSKDYEPVEYSRADEETFGFFDSRQNILDVDNNEIQNNDKVYLNRWNPKRKNITYYLSPEFSKPENDHILKATSMAIWNVNRALKKAEAGIHILLKPAAQEQKIGDLRHNMIALVEDPQSTGIIGYGPIVAYPTTGEIINGRVVMYLGTIKSLVKKTYEEMREEIIARQREDKKSERNGFLLRSALAKIQEQMSVLTQGHGVFEGYKKLHQKNVLQTSILQMNLKDDVLTTNTSKKPNEPKSQIEKAVSKYRKLDAGSLLAKESKFIDRRVDVLSKHNIYPDMLFNAEHAMKSAGIDRQIESNLKPWDELSSDEKEAIIIAVLPQIWIPTLVHEMGHNLGLKHNFAGSEDKDNFYTKDELARMGIDREIPYASVMDYAYRTSSELETMGKYDIAALRFGYARQVEDKNNQIVPLSKITNYENIKYYKYCSDDSAAANPNCNRFDEGTDLIEITGHLITSYEENYKRLNKRNNRKNFSLYQEGVYLERIKSNFYDLRLMYELYERIKNDFRRDDSDEFWVNEPYLREVYNATTLAGRFFLSLLLTPDVTCAIGLVQEPRMPIELRSLRELDDAATTCYHPDVARSVAKIGKDEGLSLIVVGEGGKSFRTRRDSFNQQPGNDQVDVQGIWIDKLMSLEYLFTRHLGSSVFDKHTQNFLDHGLIGYHMENILSSVLLGRGTIPVSFHDAEGFPVNFIGENGQDTDILPVTLDFLDDHYIDTPLVPALSKYFGLPEEQTTFQRQLIAALKRMVPTNIDSGNAKRFLNNFSVFKYEPSGKHISWAMGSDTYYALPENKVAYNAIQSIGYSQVLTGISGENIQKLIAMLKIHDPMPETAPDQIKKAYALGVEVLEAHQNGYIKSVSYYESLLDALIPVTK